MNTKIKINLIYQRTKSYGKLNFVEILKFLYSEDYYRYILLSWNQIKAYKAQNTDKFALKANMYPYILTACKYSLKYCIVPAKCMNVLYQLNV